jgi:hypothetical protein
VSHPAVTTWRPSARPPRTTWRPAAHFAPLSDAAARAHVRPAREVRPDNAAANDYVPSGRELRAFARARDRLGRRSRERNPYLAHVTGRCVGTTDEIIQWAAWKWGIPENWLRAAYMQESGWHQSGRGDLTFVGRRQVQRYPERARERDRSGAYTGRVWLSLGISQVMWEPGGRVHAGTEPLRWKSTAFAVDYHAATVRFYLDDPAGRRSDWDDKTYRRGQRWLSIGGWFEPYPWRNPAQRRYIKAVQWILAARTWTPAGRDAAISG